MVLDTKGSQTFTHLYNSLLYSKDEVLCKLIGKYLLIMMHNFSDSRTLIGRNNRQNIAGGLNLKMVALNFILSMFFVLFLFFVIFFVFFLSM